MKNSTLSRNLRRAGAVAVIAGAGVAGTGIAANAASTSTWESLAQCESGGDWGINTGNPFSGGLQFTPQTWAAFGGQGAAHNASKAEQIAVAERVQDVQGWGAWPACTAKLGISGSDGVAAAPAPAPAPAPVQVQSSAPVVQAPAVVAPVAQAPVQAPVVQAPAVVAPVAQAPVQAPVVQAPVVQAPVQAPAVQAPAASGETYVIQSGDTLSTIAQKLGIDGGWQALYELNADTLIDADLIFTGDILQLPA